MQVKLHKNGTSSKIGRGFEKGWLAAKAARPARTPTLDTSATGRGGGCSVCPHLFDVLIWDIEEDSTENISTIKASINKQVSFHYLSVIQLVLLLQGSTP